MKSPFNLKEKASSFRFNWILQISIKLQSHYTNYWRKAISIDWTRRWVTAELKEMLLSTLSWGYPKKWDYFYYGRVINRIWCNFDKEARRVWIEFLHVLAKHWPKREGTIQQRNGIFSLFCISRIIPRHTYLVESLCQRLIIELWCSNIVWKTRNYHSNMVEEARPFWYRTWAQRRKRHSSSRLYVKSAHRRTLSDKLCCRVNENLSQHRRGLH